MKPAKTPKAAPVLGASGHRIDLASAKRIAAANAKAGFPTPPHVQALLDAADAPAPPAAEPSA